MSDSTPDLFCSTFTADAARSTAARNSKGAHFAAVLCSSLLLHGLLLVVLDRPAQRVISRPERVKVTVVAAPPQEKAEPAPAAAPEPPIPQVASKPHARKALSKHPAEPESAPAVSRPPTPEAAAPEPLDFTGVTLTAPGEAGWSSVTGNGEAGQGPLGAPPRGVHAGSGHGSGSTLRDSSGGPRVAALGSLSRPPRAPQLDQELLKNYPKGAREQGIPGHAVVRMRILPDGRVGKVQVLTASSGEFGRACERTVTGSRFSAPLDERGQPVATDISYTCQFEVIR